MEELKINDYLQKENLFELFRLQLQKDFESSGLDAGFTNKLPSHFDLLKLALLNQLKPLIRNNSQLLPVLLYRIDIGEQQLKNHQQLNPQMSYEEGLAELIIKRELQKVILKKTFSSSNEHKN